MANNLTFQSAAMATLLYAAAKNIIKGEVEDLSKELKKLEGHEEIEKELKKIKNAKVPGGYYSDELDQYISNFLIAGLATKRSPIELNSEGIIECKNLIKSAKKIYGDKMEYLLKIYNLLEE